MPAHALGWTLKHVHGFPLRTARVQLRLDTSPTRFFIFSSSKLHHPANLGLISESCNASVICYAKGAAQSSGGIGELPTQQIYFVLGIHELRSVFVSRPFMMRNARIIRSLIK